MRLSEKILSLRKRSGLSQKELAGKLNVSRQAVSRWEVGSALPDASNILQLSKLFGVTADYLLNDDYESDRDIPAVKNAETIANKKIKNSIAILVSIFGLLGNFILYLLSRTIGVINPELLAIIFWGLFLAGLVYLLISSAFIQDTIKKHKERRKQA